MRRVVLVVCASLLMSLVPAAPASATNASILGSTSTKGYSLDGDPWTLDPNFPCYTGSFSNTGTGPLNAYRCAVEFDMSSIPDAAVITAASVSWRAISPCSTTCPVDLVGYAGNGSNDISDLTSGSLLATFVPTGAGDLSDVTTYVVGLHAGDLDWAGFRLSAAATSPAGGDRQVWDDVDHGSSARLLITYTVQVDVEVHIAGVDPGSASVTSDPFAIDCGETCLATFESGTTVTLTATSFVGGDFISWQGAACAGQGNPCSFTVGLSAVEVTATFSGIGPPVSAPPDATAGPTASSGTPASPAPTRSSQTPSGAPSLVPGTDVPTTGPSGEIISPVPGATLDATTPAPSAVPTEPAAETGGSPMVLILLVVLIALGLGGALFYRQRRRGGTAPPVA